MSVARNYALIMYLSRSHMLACAASLILPLRHRNSYDRYISESRSAKIIAITDYGFGAVSFITDTKLAEPYGMWLDSNNNDLYVADHASYAILRFVNAAGIAEVVPMPWGLSFGWRAGNAPHEWNERPTDVGGAPWGAIYFTEQNDGAVVGVAGGLFLAGPAASNTSIGGFTWTDPQGIWLDC